MKPYNILVYIGRFQPFHNAHLKTIEIASSLADKVIVIIGSHNAPRTTKNPFTFSERSNMILNSVQQSQEFDKNCMLIIDRCEDNVYDDAEWVSRIKKIVEPHAGDNIGVIGHSKDDSSFYLQLFNDWKFHPIDRISDINATDIRNVFLDDENVRHHSGLNHLVSTCDDFLKENVPTIVYDAIKYFINGKHHRLPFDDYEKLKNEYSFIENHKSQYDDLEQKPIFVTSHSLIVFKEKILVNIRNSDYGKGLFELPGDYLNSLYDKNVLSSISRVLSEKFENSVAHNIFINQITHVEIFDKINRSPLGRHIAHIHYADISNLDENTITTDSSMVWLDIENLNRADFFEDNYDIIIKMLKTVRR
jgi:bifunctional NMN adenylyltransferase/nudix hydrolase